MLDSLKWVIKINHGLHTTYVSHGLQIYANRQREQGNNYHLAFYHLAVNDCYFYLTKSSGYSKKTQWKLSYPNHDSTLRPVPKSHEIPGTVDGRWGWYMWIGWKSWTWQWYRLCEYINQRTWKLQPARTQWFN